jgi:hypothetical protein
MLAHCSAWTEMAAGLKCPPRSLIGRVFGRFAKAAILVEESRRRNMPSENSLILKDEHQFAEEQQRVLAWIYRFVVGGPEQCIWSFLSPGIIIIRWASLKPLKAEAERRIRRVASNPPSKRT